MLPQDYMSPGLNQDRPCTAFFLEQPPPPPTPALTLTAADCLPSCIPQRCAVAAQHRLCGCG